MTNFISKTGPTRLDPTLILQSIQILLSSIHNKPAT